ncbi:MAG: PAS domain S-box protein [Rhizobacter sp.]|nr:PAS domain S-box protein [Rhizobacter sp.]
MGSWFERRSVRVKIVMLVLTILLPAAAMLAWLLAAYLREAREAAQAKVQILAVSTRDDLERLLHQSQAVLARLAVRPLVKALDPSRCDPVVAEFMQPYPAFNRLGLYDAQGRLVCAYLPDPQPGLADAAGFGEALRTGRFSAGSAMRQGPTGRWVSVLSHPVRNEAGAVVGVLSMSMDLLGLNQQLMAAVPSQAVVSVVDRERAMLLRSEAVETFVGKHPAAADGDPLQGVRDGFQLVAGRDGVLRLVAFTTIPGVDWQVAAGLPESEVFADYNAIRRNTLGLGAVALLLALALAWHLAVSILRPIGRLARTAAEVAGGNRGVRAPLTGPAEVEAVARQFNLMLDASDAAEAALRESEARLHGIIESATDAILTVDETQTIVMANPAAAAMFGHAMGELVGAPLECLIPARYHGAHRRDVHAFGGSRTTARHMGSARDVMGLRANGEEFPVDAAISHLTTGGQRLYTVILRDITERRRTEDALRDSEARLRRLLTLLPEAVFVNTDDRVSFVNQAAQRLFGADEAALLGRSPLELIHPDSRELVTSGVGTLRGGVTVAPLVELKILRADGEARWVESMSTLIHDHRGRSILVVMRDVTDLRQAQAELTRSHLDLQRLIEARERVQDEERKRIARELHDDLQQTLAAIRIDVVAIGGRLDGDRAQVGPILAEIDTLAQSAVASTRRIVNDLRPQALEDLGLVAGLENLLALFGQRTGIDCQLDAAEATGEALMAWPAVSTCLYRVTQEALNNVAKHAQATAVRVQLDTAVGGQAWLRVSDNGRGMSDAERRKSDSFGLLGMHERVRALGGVLQVQSTPGAGTSVEALIPLHDG